MLYQRNILANTGVGAFRAAGSKAAAGLWIIGLANSPRMTSCCIVP